MNNWHNLIIHGASVAPENDGLPRHLHISIEGADWSRIYVHLDGVRRLKAALHEATEIALGADLSLAAVERLKELSREAFTAAQ